MRKRTKPRVVWLPADNANSIDVPDNLVGIQTFAVDTSGAAPKAVGEIPLTIDGLNEDPLIASNSLSDIENSGYRLRRIVGKIWVVVRQTDDASAFRTFVTAAVIVRRANPVTGVSTAFATADLDQVTPQDIAQWGDPWIWRRSWLLGNNLGTSKLPSDDDLPSSNIEYGSAVDGAHVDQKTARIVSAEERLFLDVGVFQDRGGAQDEITNSVLVFTDLRILATMRSSTGNRRNASR